MSKLTAPLVCAGTLAADISAKTWARQTLVLGESQPFIPGFLRFTLTTNTGAAFGMGRDNGLVMTLVALAITVFFLVLYIKKERDQSLTSIERVAVGLILGGAVGNLLDRFLRGSVTDFLEFAFISFPVFNVADMCIDIGGGLFAIGFFLEQARQKHQM